MKTRASDAPSNAVAANADVALAADLFASAHRFLWHAATRTAILADLHLGIEAALIRQGLHVPGMPPPQLAALILAWEKIKARGPARVVIAGDLFDSPEPTEPAVELCRRLFRQPPADARIVITRGNHDSAAENLSGIFSGLPVSVADHFRLAGHLISHGHALPTETPSGGFWIAGHQHPAVILRTRVQSAKMACFAVLGGERTILLPAFSRAPLGSNLLIENNWLLPIPRPQNESIRIAGLVEPADTREAQVLDFGPLSLLG